MVGSFGSHVQVRVVLVREAVIELSRVREIYQRDQEQRGRVHFQHHRGICNATVKLETKVLAAGHRPSPPKDSKSKSKQQIEPFSQTRQAGGIRENRHCAFHGRTWTLLREGLPDFTGRYVRSVRAALRSRKSTSPPRFTGTRLAK